MKKRKFRFDVDLKVQELSSIPFLNGVLFCKARLINGGDYRALTSRRDVVHHTVKWDSRFAFSCKLSSLANGVLESCICRLSVRKEVKGGKSYEKLGFVDVNLAECAGSGTVSRRYILQGYHDSKKHRQDNSMLKVEVTMILTSGDPLFKPQVSTLGSVLPLVPSASDESTSEQSVGAGAHVVSGSSLELDDLVGLAQGDAYVRPDCDSPRTQHFRSSSSSSVKMYTGIGSSTGKRSSSTGQSVLGHSRQSSNSTGDSACADLDVFHVTSPGVSRNFRRSADLQRKIGDTRVNADVVIDQLFDSANLNSDATITDEGIEMSMFLERDGVSTMSKIETKRLQQNAFPDNIEDRFKTL